MTSSASLSLLASSHLISQGAEAKVYKGYLEPDGQPVLLKYRFKKGYRHQVLDGALTKARVAGEARALIKCLRSGVNVPGVRMVDATVGLIGIEWIEGRMVKSLLPGGSAEEGLDGNADVPIEAQETTTEDTLSEFGVSTETLMSLIGTEIAKMHLAEIIHGDLTTSNMMLRLGQSQSAPASLELVLIDFGLSYHSTLPEDRAVDLYVLERAFASTHPDSEPLFREVLSAYAERLGKEWGGVGGRLDDVRLRGRKRSMMG